MRRVRGAANTERTACTTKERRRDVEPAQVLHWNEKG